MVTYVRVRTIKPGQFENAVNFLREYKGFLKSEYDMDVNFGTEVGRLGTMGSILAGGLPVITSYSIHYTKLYDALTSRRDALTSRRDALTS